MAIQEMTPAVVEKAMRRAMLRFTEEITLDHPVDLETLEFLPKELTLEESIQSLENRDKNVGLLSTHLEESHVYLEELRRTRDFLRLLTEELSRDLVTNQ